MLCEGLKKDLTCCLTKANYIFNIDNKKYCLKHLLSEFNKDQKQKDKSFKACKKLSEIDNYTKITKDMFTNDQEKNNNVPQETSDDINEQEDSSEKSNNDEDIRCLWKFPNSKKKCASKAKSYYVLLDDDIAYCRKHLLEKINTNSSEEEMIKSISACKNRYKIVTSSEEKIKSKPKKNKNNVEEDISENNINDEEKNNTNDKILSVLNKKNENFKFGDLLGKGTFGSVYNLVHIPTNEEYAIKISYYDAKNAKESKLALDLIHSEYSTINNILCSNTNNPNIISLMDRKIGVPFAYQKEEYAFIVLQKCFCSLDVAVNSNSLYEGNDLIEITKKIGMDIIHIMEYIHKRGMLYIDIKPQNIMFKDETLNDIVLIDFGIYKTWKDSKQDVKEQVNIKETEGTDLFASKNLNNKKSSSRIDDIETIGYIMMYVYNKGKLPWDNEKSVSNIFKRKSEFCFSSDGEEFPNFIVEFLEETNNYHFQQMPEYNKFKNILTS